MVAGSLRRRPYRVGLSERRLPPRLQARRPSRSARIPPSVAPGASSTLTWSSTNATSCSGTGFSPSGASGSSLVSPTVSTTYSITCTGGGGSTAQSAAVTVSRAQLPSAPTSVGARTLVAPPASSAPLLPFRLGWPSPAATLAFGAFRRLTGNRVMSSQPAAGSFRTVLVCIATGLDCHLRPLAAAVVIDCSPLPGAPSDSWRIRRIASRRTTALSWLAHSRPLGLILLRCLRDRSQSSAQTAHRDLLRISDLNAERTVIDAHMDERQRHGL